MNLEELVKRCRNHDEEAVTELINETKTSGFFVARMITGEALKTSDFDETHYEELVEKAKTDETVKEELTAYEEKYASIISLKDARDQAERNVNNKKSESEYYYSFAVQVIIDLKDAQNVVALVEARNDALVSFDTLVKEISAKDPLTHNRQEIPHLYRWWDELLRTRYFIYQM